jgi:O-antigen ligase
LTSLSDAAWANKALSFALPLVTLLFLVLPLAHLTGLRNSLAVLIALWAFTCLIRERLVPPLAIPIAAWLLLGTASALWSPDARDTVKAAFYDIVLPAGAFYGAYILSRRAVSYRILCAAIIAGSVMIAALTLLAYGLTSAEQISRAADRSGALLYYHPGEGATSTLCVYVLPIALLLASDAGRGTRSLGYLGLACIVIAGIASGNRMFWPSAVAVLAAFWAWQWPVLRIGQRITAAGVLVVCAVTAIGMVAGKDPLAVVARDNRPPAWQQWGKIATEAPLLGYGLGLKSIKSTAKVKLPADFAQRNPEMEFHAHSLLLDIVLQVGVVGLALFAVLLVALAREAWRARDGPECCAVGAALVALLVAMLAKNATDDFMHHAVVIAFWGYAGVLLGRLSAVRIIALMSDQPTTSKPVLALR